MTQTLDWVQAFASRRATLIAGTGYQYGDTDFLEYSERLYTGFATALRAGTGPVAVGDALVAAKQAYLEGDAAAARHPHRRRCSRRRSTACRCSASTCRPGARRPPAARRS